MSTYMRFAVARAWKMIRKNVETALNPLSPLSFLLFHLPLSIFHSFFFMVLLFAHRYTIEVARRDF